MTSDMIFIVDGTALIAKACKLSLDPGNHDWRIDLYDADKHFVVTTEDGVEAILALVHSALGRLPGDDGREDPEDGRPLPAGIDGCAVGAGAGRKAVTTGV